MPKKKHPPKKVKSRVRVVVKAHRYLRYRVGGYRVKARKGRKGYWVRSHRRRWPTRVETYRIVWDGDYWAFEISHHPRFGRQINAGLRKWLPTFAATASKVRVTLWSHGNERQRIGDTLKDLPENAAEFWSNFHAGVREIVDKLAEGKDKYDHIEAIVTEVKVIHL